MNIKVLLKRIPFFHGLAVTVRSCVRPNRLDQLRKLEVVSLNCIESLLQSLETARQHLQFVKVGANDGITDDPCGDYFLKRQRWNGLLIEPVGYCVEKLKAVYKDDSRFIVEQRAIGTQQGSAPFYYLAKEAKESLPNLPIYYDQLGSFNRQHITKHFEIDVERFIRTETVEVSPLSIVLERLGFLGASFLHIDTEGFDLEVLKTLDFSKCHPDALLIEHKHLSDTDLLKLIRLLKAARYRILNTGYDVLAISTSGEQSNAYGAAVERFIGAERLLPPPGDS